MDNTKNALAKLATNLIDAMTAIAETGLIADRHVDTINHAQRIIAELSKVNWPSEGTERAFAKCLAIAKEECNNEQH